MVVHIFWRVGFVVILVLVGLGTAASVSAEAELVQPATYWPTEGWHTATPESHGLTPELPALIDQRLRAEAPQLSAFVVVKDGAMRLSASPFGPQLTEGELRSRLRQEGVFDVESVHLVIVEPTGRLSYADVEAVPRAALSDVVERD